MKYAAILVTPLFLWLPAMAQEAPEQRGLVSSDLVAWSSMQQPQQPERGRPHSQPTPDSGIETEPAAKSTPSSGRPSSAAPSERPQVSSEVFSGSIVKQGDHLLLRVSRTSWFRLDKEDQAQPFQGGEVRVTGTLDPEQNLVHVEDIEPLS